MTRGRYRWALAVVSISAFMITMDNTVIFNALSTIARDLDMGKGSLDWVATGYILMFSCLMIAGGRLCDIYGCRRVFIVGMGIFTAASGICGFAHDGSVLILARILQGAGAALALPATQVVITVGRTDKQRSLGTIAWVSAAGGATALGPTIGGLIVQQWHWGWIFLINIPPGLLVMALGWFILTDKDGGATDSRVDLPGVLISATMLFALIYGLESGRHQGWTNPAVLAVFALAAIALMCFIVVERWAPDPMVNLEFFRNRVFVGGLISQMLWGMGFNGMIFYAATFLQRFLDFSPPKAGLVMLPSAIVVMAFTPVSFWIAAKLGPRLAIGGGMALMAIGMAVFSRIDRSYGFGELMPGVVLVGLGSAMVMPLVMYVLKSVPEERAGVAAGILNVIREASGAFGIAVMGILIHEIPPVGADDAALETFRHGVSWGLILGASLVLIGAVISGVMLPSRRGWTGPKHKRRPPPPAVPAAQPIPEPVPVGAAAMPEPLPTIARPAPPPTPEPEPEPWMSSRATPLDGLPVVSPQDISVRRWWDRTEVWPPPPPEDLHAPTDGWPPDRPSARPPEPPPPRAERRQRTDVWWNTEDRDQ